MAAHRDDGQGDDITLIFGLSRSQEFSGGILRVSNVPSGNIWKDVRKSTVFTHRRGSVSYDVFLGRCVVLQNAEHAVQRMHWGKRSVVIVTAKPIND